MNTIFKIAAIIVIYNKEIEESVTCQNLKQIKKNNLDIFVVDNSTVKNNNEKKCEEHGYVYITMCGNQGLSKAYNVAINRCYDTHNVLVLMDDDTEVTSDYFDVLEKALSENPDVDIFAPIVYGQDGVIYSPNKFNFLRNHFISSETQEISQESFNAISSMLAIRMRVFDDYRFNERLFIDQVDQNFFCEQRARNRKFMKLDVIIHQNFFQRGPKLTSETGWRRLKLRIVDIMKHAELMGSKKYKLLGLIKCGGLGVQIGKKSKSFIIPFKATFLALRMLFLKNKG